MRFGRQRFFIFLGAVGLPFVFAVALANNPNFSTYALKIALKILRLRTGLKVGAERWSINPVSFSAELTNTTFEEESFAARIPRLKIQISPLGLFLLRLHVYRVDVEGAEFRGQVPGKWLKSQQSSDEWKRDIPGFVGQTLRDVYRDLDQSNMEVEQLNIFGARSDLADVKFAPSEIHLQILKDGQAKAEWAISEIEIPSQLAKIHRIEGAAALLKETRKNFFISLRRFELALFPIEGNLISATGRMPGTLNASGTIFLNDINDWLKKGKLSQDYAQKDSVAGQIELKVNSHLSSRMPSDLHGDIAGKNLRYDGYKVQSLTGDVSWGAGGSLDLDNLTLVFPRSKLDPAESKNTIVLKNISVKDKKIRGEVTPDKVGICAFLDALTVEECWAAFQFSGEAKFEGSLSPFLIGLEGKFQTGVTRVGTEPLRTASGNELLFAKPATIEAGADIGPEQLDIRKAVVRFSEQSSVNLNGSIFYKPAVVDLNLDSSRLELADAIDTFINLHVSGVAETRTKISYSLMIPKEKGRTTVLSHVSVNSIAIEKQVLGVAAGNVNYQNNELTIGPVDLKNGGGKAVVTGSIKQHPQFGSEMEVHVNANRLEMNAILPSSKSPFLSAFISGQSHLKGYLSPEKGGKYLNGPIEVVGDNVTIFGINLQRANVKARYEDKILFLDQIIADKDRKTVFIDGRLHPVSGSRIDFKSQAIPVKNLGYFPELERIFSDSVAEIQGFWTPAHGWEVRGDVGPGHVAQASLPKGSFVAKGDGKFVEVLADFSPAVYYSLRSAPEGEKLHPLEMKVRARDQGIVVGMAYLKGWTAPTDIYAQGQIDFAWTPERGHLNVDSLLIRGPSGFENTFGDILKMNAPLRAAWEGDRISENSGWTDDKLPVTIRGQKGDKAFAVKAKLPMALFDSLIPGSQKIYTGEAIFDATVPISPYITTVKGKGQLQNVGLLLPGVGRPLQELQGNFILTESRFIMPQGRAKMGSGLVDFRAEYLIDLKKPGVVLDATLNRAQILVQDDIPMDVTGEVSMRGDSYPYLLSGRLLVSNGVYSREFNQPTAAAVLPKNERAKATIVYNLDLEIGSNFEVKNSIINAPLTGRLVMSGNDVSPLITGYFDLNRGMALAKDNEFQISQARVQLPTEAGQPSQVFMRAFTNIRYLNQTYRIEMNIRGPSNNLVFEFTSDPPLPNADIINLLAFGTLRDSQESGFTNRSGVETAQYEALQALFGQAIGKSINKNTGFDVRVSSARDLSQKSTIPKVTVQRRLSKNITATFGRSLDASKPERNFQVDYRVFNNVNVTGVWESPTPEKSSTGVDLRFKFDVK